MVWGEVISQQTRLRFSDTVMQLDRSSGWSAHAHLQDLQQPTPHTTVQVDCQATLTTLCVTGVFVYAYCLQSTTTHLYFICAARLRLSCMPSTVIVLPMAQLQG
jgi:hypothetical protein